VWLFGSLAQRRFVHAGSDIDLAVEGLPPEDYFRALVAIWRQLPPGFRLDLAPLEDAKPSLLDVVREEGELLYERA
jgi:predicted nucleotidyltransferase